MTMKLFVPVLLSCLMNCSSKESGSSSGSEPQELTRYRDLVKRICECTDASCVSTIQGEYTKMSKDVVEAWSAARQRKDNAALKALDELDTRYAECGKKFAP